MNYDMNYLKAQQIAQSVFFIKQGEIREPIYNAYGEQMCKICRNANSGKFNEVGLHLCIPCADLIANIYTHLRTDKFATWSFEHEQSERQSREYKKAVISQTLRTQVFERDEYRCINCGTHKELCADHIHPESRGGETTLDNLQTLCRSCNSQKGTKTMNEWRAD